MYVRELKYTDESSMNVYDDDVEETLKWVVVPKSTWKLYDRYCYSILTDNLEVDRHVIEKAKNLKIDKIVTFRNFKTIDTKVTNKYEEKK